MSYPRDWFWSIVAWATFTLGLALLQVWAAVLFKYLIEAPIELLTIMKGGGLYFYSNSLVMHVVRDKWTRIRENKQVNAADFGAMFIVPTLVLIVTVIAYIAILTRPDVTSRLIRTQFIVAPLAILHSLTHTVRKLSGIE